MDEQNAKGHPDIPVNEGSGDEGAADIVGRTGEEMPIAMHDQGHRTFRAAAPDQAFDPRVPNRKPPARFE